jgi:hypothetical protein
MKVEAIYKVGNDIESKLMTYQESNGKGYYIGNTIVECKPNISYEIRRVNNRIIGFLHNPFFENIIMEKLNKLWPQSK